MSSYSISNEAGEIVFDAQSDAEACRWWFDNGRQGDFLADTGETMSEVAECIWPDVVIRYDRSGQVLSVEGAD